MVPVKNAQRGQAAFDRGSVQFKRSIVQRRVDHLYPFEGRGIDVCLQTKVTACIKNRVRRGNAREHQLGTGHRYTRSIADTDGQPRIGLGANDTKTDTGQRGVIHVGGQIKVLIAVYIDINDVLRKRECCLRRNEVEGAERDRPRDQCLVRGLVETGR